MSYGTETHEGAGGHFESQRSRLAAAAVYTDTVFEIDIKDAVATLCTFLGDAIVTGTICCHSSCNTCRGYIHSFQFLGSQRVRTRGDTVDEEPKCPEEE